MERETFIAVCEELVRIMEVGTYEEAKHFLQCIQFPENIEGETIRTFLNSVLNKFNNEDELKSTRQILDGAIEALKSPKTIKSP